jgi:hypothetical protein
MAGKVHDNDKKAEVMAALLEGKTQHDCELLYGVPQQTISRWARGEDGFHVLRQANIHDKVFKYLATNLETLAIQSEFTRNPEWLQKQDAASLGTLMGITADKCFRLLAAMERAASTDTSAS